MNPFPPNLGPQLTALWARSPPLVPNCCSYESEVFAQPQVCAEGGEQLAGALTVDKNLPTGEQSIITYPPTRGWLVFRLCVACLIASLAECLSTPW